MAPALREVTQTVTEQYTTYVTIVTLGNFKAWPTSNFVTLTGVEVDPSATAVASDTADTPAWSYSAGTSGGLSSGAKGAIAGSILGTAFLLLLLYCWCQRPPRTRFTHHRRRQFVKMAPPEPPQEPTDTPEGEVPKRPKKKKTVTIAPEPPKEPKDPKDPKRHHRQGFSPVVKFTTDMTSKTTIDIRESKRETRCLSSFGHWRE
ncbi:uncharacterized protein N7529_004395 [Penicillium soppii]|uniref:uncharacterized protein n=1 Tax=Penicillium soppii TaxID=69789 RepID=UPI002546CBC5|nr:uncharacterized protein N7529_004395 [Penicillium soppii]KAJ5872042.1 hypothetical protein N7529_004395 [Penicillium soppii]